MSANLDNNENPFEVLGIARNADEAAIKQAYFALVREHSPERDPAGFKRIRAAYEKLRNASDRVSTNLFLVDDQPQNLNADAIQVNASLPALISRELIIKDLIELEIFLLLEELRSPAIDKSPAPSQTRLFSE